MEVDKIIRILPESLWNPTPGDSFWSFDPGLRGVTSMNLGAKMLAPKKPASVIEKHHSCHIWYILHPKKIDLV